jgi:CheY-like chemotaxis protein
MTNITVDHGQNLVRPEPWAGLTPPGTVAAVLHVEDDPNDALLVKLSFRKAQLPVLLQHVTDGQQAVNYLSGTVPYSDRLSFPLPGLVLLDLKLPLLDGFGVLAWARAQPGLTDLRIIVLSSSNQPEDIARAKRLGADDYLVKASGYEEVVNAVQGYILRPRVSTPTIGLLISKPGLSRTSRPRLRRGPGSASGAFGHAGGSCSLPGPADRR